MTDVVAEPTALYQFFDGTGGPLYYGITKELAKRFAHHRGHKEWWPDVDHDRTRIQWFDSRDEAATAELAAIRNDRPRHNIVTSDDQGCARFLPRPDGGRWGRQKWAEQASAEDLAAAEHVVALHRRWQDADAAYKRQLAKLADPEGDAVPVAYLARRLGFTRKTVYRHLGRQMT